MNLISNQLDAARRRGELLAAAAMPPVVDGGAPALRPPEYRLKRQPNRTWAIYQGHRYVKGTKTKDYAEAQQALDVYELQQEAEREGIVNVPNSEALAVTAYYVAQIPAAAGSRMRRDAVDRLQRIEPHLAGLRLRDLKGDKIAAIEKAMLASYAHASVYGALLTLRTAIRVFCRDHGSPEILPFGSPRVPAGRTRVLSAQELELIRRWADCREDYHPATGTWSPAVPDQRERHRRLMVWRTVALALPTGSRGGKLEGLAWRSDGVHGHIDVEKGILHRNPPGKPVAPRKRAPAVALPPQLLAEVRRWKVEDDRVGHTYVIRNVHGGPATCRVGELFSQAMRELGIFGVTRHTLRHTAVTRMIEEGLPASIICSIVGMAPYTLRVRYNHADDATVQRFGHPHMDGLLSAGCRRDKC